MNKLLTLVALLVLSACSPRIYQPADFNSKTANHKTVAILPAQVILNLRPNEMRRLSPEDIARNEKATGMAMQEKLYGWFLRRSNNYNYTVTFQDVTETNALLKKADIDYEDLPELSRSELSRRLGVDAIISPSLRTNKPMNEGVALALGLTLGVWGQTNQAFTTINIHEATRGDLVWKYDFQASGSVGSSPEQLVNALMRNASRRFPYNGR